jgi:hypothetical protein
MHEAVWDVVTEHTPSPDERRRDSLMGPRIVSLARFFSDAVNRSRKQTSLQPVPHVPPQSSPCPSASSTVHSPASSRTLNSSFQRRLV